MQHTLSGSSLINLQGYAGNRMLLEMWLPLTYITYFTKVAASCLWNLFLQYLCIKIARFTKILSTTILSNMICAGAAMSGQIITYSSIVDFEQVVGLSATERRGLSLHPSTLDYVYLSNQSGPNKYSLDACRKCYTSRSESAIAIYDNC